MASSINNDVNIGGVQAITGRKIFNSSGYSKIVLKSKDMDLSTTPTESINNQLWFADKNNVQYAVLQANKNNDGSVNFSMTMKAKPENNYTTLSVVQQENGTAFSIAPATDKANSILTTLAMTKSLTGGVKLGNGLIINHGIITGAGANPTVTFSVPFTSTNYVIIPQLDRGGSAGLSGAVYNIGTKKKTSVIVGLTTPGITSGRPDLSYIAIGY